MKSKLQLLCLLTAALIISLPALSIAKKSKDKTGVTILVKEKCYPGFRLYSSRKTEVAHLIDLEGNQIHKWSYPQGHTWHYAQMLPDGHLIAIVANKMILELDWDSNLVWKYKTQAHHDFARKSDGNTLVVSKRKLKYPKINEKKELDYDYILEVTPDNEIVWQWNAEEHLDQLKEKVDLILPCEKFRDWPHINTCEVLPDSPTAKKDPRFKKGNLLMCGRHIDTIFVVEYPSGKILWAWGPGKILGPHMPTMLPNGNILLYDNGQNTSRYKRNYSRIIELDPLTEKIVWIYQSPTDFYSPSRGSNQRLPNGNTLIAESDSYRLFEVTPQGQTVWQFHNPDRQPLYRTICYPPNLVNNLMNENK